MLAAAWRDVIDINLVEVLVEALLGKVSTKALSEVAN